MDTYSLARVDVASVAKILGVVGLLWGLIVGVMWTATGLVGGPSPGLTALAAATVGGTLYGVIAGAVTALIYNAAAGLVGGIEFELSAIPTAASADEPSLSRAGHRSD